jgi:RNA polymerase sigma factor (sigma-70 family)
MMDRQNRQHGPEVGNGWRAEASAVADTYGRREGFSVHESDTIACEAGRVRALDRALAQSLDLAGSTAPAVSSGYMQCLGRRAHLPLAAERRLVREALEGDRHARAQLVEAYLPLIGSVARNYRSSRQVTHTELMQEGVVGLLRALERYDPELGVPFWGYASWWVRQAMQQLVAELTRPVVMSDRALRQLSRIKDAYASMLEEGRDATLERLSGRTGLDSAQLANLIAADRPPKAFEEPIRGEEGEIGAFGELISDPLAEDEYERVITSIAIGELRDLLSGLSDRERLVLGARYGFDGEAESLREIAGRLGVSAERVRQIESRALGKLRAAAVGTTEHALESVQNRSRTVSS